MSKAKLSKERLHNLMIEVLSKSETFCLETGTMPFLMTWRNNLFYIYVKNLSSAYFKDRPDTTRAQLATKDIFERVINTQIPFIFFGYDNENDVLVCWDFHIAKSRLNERKSISFYSRSSLQREVKEGDFLRRELRNGDCPVLFKRTDLPHFFDNINSFFPNKEIEISLISGKIEEIKDIRLLNKLRPMLNTDTPRTLEAIQVAQRFYGKIPSMTFTDWMRLIKTIRFG